MELEISERGAAVFTTADESAAIEQKPQFLFADAELFSGIAPDGTETVIICKTQSNVPHPCAHPVYVRPFDVCDMLDETLGRPSIIDGASKKKRTQAEGLRLHAQTHSATYRGEHIALSKKEFSLLSLLMEKKGQTVSRAEATEKVFGEKISDGTNIVDVYVKYLREKIDERFGIKVISSVRGIGYTIKSE